MIFKQIVRMSQIITLALAILFAWSVSRSFATVTKPSSCAELLLDGNTQSGVYTIYPRLWFSPVPFDVYCDMETDGGGWTVFQRRDDYEVKENFFRDWESYKIGFGKLIGEFWLGNDHLYALSNQDYVTLRIDLEDFEGNMRKAIYNLFKVDSEKDKYKLSISGYLGDAGDSLSGYNGVPFVTKDRDIDDCSKLYKGGWWYLKCHQANLNGLYLKGNHSSFADGIEWNTWKGYYYSLKRTEMKIRPTHFMNWRNANLK